jgi:ABC-2 type transport system ATP-binding protein
MEVNSDQNTGVLALEVDGLLKSYGDYRALDGVSMAVRPGRIVGLLGPNGAGKSTLIRIVMGILGADAGRVLVNGAPWTRDVLRNVGYLPEERGLYKDMKVGEQAMYFAKLHGMSKQEAVLALRSWFERLEVDGWWDKKVEDLSKGMAQKVQFICAVVHQPKVLILDEPLSGFDPVNARRIVEEIRRLAASGTAVLLSTHDMSRVEALCDEVLLLNKGKIVMGGESEALRESGWHGEYAVTYCGSDVAFARGLGASSILGDVDRPDDPSEAPTRAERTALITLRSGFKLSDTLAGVADAVDIVEVRKLRPTMQELFIQAVSTENTESNA